MILFEEQKQMESEGPGHDRKSSISLNFCFSSICSTRIISLKDDKGWALGKFLYSLIPTSKACFSCALIIPE